MGTLHSLEELREKRMLEHRRKKNRQINCRLTVRWTYHKRKWKMYDDRTET